MYDQSFTKSSLARAVKNSDYYTHPNFKDDYDLLIDQAFNKAQAGFTVLPDVGITVVKKKNKTKKIYRLKNFADRLLVRKITRNIKVVSRAKQQNRDAIIKNLRTILAEGVAYRIYRLDIKDFYGSIDVPSVVNDLENDWRISRPTIRLVKNIFSHFGSVEIGLPRGVQVSATLAEYCMISFDEAISNVPQVFFYVRFVDDILILTSGEESEGQFLDFIAKHLPDGVSLNKKKEYIQLVEKVGKGVSVSGSVASFTFLGYIINVFHPQTSATGAVPLHTPRPVELDVSPNKVRKIKTRIIKAFLAYLKDRNFLLLYDRIKVLTGNYYIYDRDRNCRRMAGIFYSYKYATANPSDIGSAVYSLDKFLCNVLLSGRGRVSSQLRNGLTKAQRRKLMGLTFKRGFAKRTIHHFHNKRMIAIARCWGHD